MNTYVFGFICLLIGAVGGMVISSLMFAASDEDRCKDCLNKEMNERSE